MVREAGSRVAIDVGGGGWMWVSLRPFRGGLYECNFGLFVWEMGLLKDGL